MNTSADWSLADLHTAWDTVRRKGSRGGYDGQDLAEYGRELNRHLQALLQELNERSYTPDPGLRVYIPKGDGRRRPLGLLTIRDKLVQVAVKPRLEALLEPLFHNASYAYRPDKGHRKAVARVEHEIRAGNPWVAAADIAAFFDNLNHGKLISQVSAAVEDAWLRELIELWLAIGVVERGKPCSTPRGVQQGGVVSPLLANLYLNGFDHFLEEQGIAFVRYADDFVMLCPSRERAEAALELAEAHLQNELQLELNTAKRELASLDEGFCFLGVRFQGEHRTIDPAKVAKALATIEGWRFRCHRLEQLLERAQESFQSWHYYYGQLESQSDFALFDRALGNQVSLFMQHALRGKEKRGRPQITALLEGCTWLLAHDTPQARETWIRKVLDFDSRRLHERGYRYLPWQDPSIGEAITRLAADPVPAALPAVPAPSPQARPADTVSQESAPSGGETPSGSPLSVQDRVKRRRRKVQRWFLGEQTLVVSRPGTVLRRRGDRIRVELGGKVLRECPLKDLKHIWLLSSNITLTGPVIQSCLAAGLPLELCGPRGEVVGSLSGPQFPVMRCTPLQQQARQGPLGLEVAREMALGKIGNQVKLLRYFGKSRQEDAVYTRELESLEQRMTGWTKEITDLDPLLDPPRFRETLRNLEAQAAKAYWGVIRLTLPEEVDFPGRKRQGARDLVNSLLNYGYGVLYNTVWRAVVQAGLNPAVSFFHEPFRGKPTLTYDLIEEFRAPMVDRVVFSLLSRREPLELDRQGLTWPSRRLLVRNLLERWSLPCRYRSKEEVLGEIPVLQAKLLVAVLEGKVKAYRSWAFKW